MPSALDHPALAAWRALFVRRWHSNPDLSDLHDDNAAHHGRCGILALTLFPGCWALLAAAVSHDAAEVFVGDIAYTKRDREFSAALDAAEAKELERMGLSFDLTQMERRQLKLIDRLDAYLFVRHRRPHVLVGDGWPEQLEWLIQEWRDVGAAGRPEEML